MPRPRDDIRVAASFFQHPKARRMRRDLGPAGVLAVLELWAWAAGDGRLDGTLSGLDDGAIEMAAGWEGEAGAWVAAACRLKLLDGAQGARAIHDWREEQPWLSTREERLQEARESGSRGGRARADRLTPEERRASATLAASARWEAERDAKGMRSGPTQDAKACVGDAKGMRSDAYLSGSGSGSGSGPALEERETPAAPAPLPRVKAKCPKPSRTEVADAFDARAPLHALPSLRGTVLEWYDALRGTAPTLKGSKVWNSTAALGRHLDRLAGDPARAVRVVELCRDERWTDSGAGFEHIYRSERNGTHNGKYTHADQTGDW